LQVMPNPKKLQESLCQNIILVPMSDHVRNYTQEQWQAYLPYKFINFSRTLDQKLKALGAKSLHVQFFPEPISNGIIPEKINKKLKFFFWQRGAEITFDIIKQLVPPEDVEVFYFHRMGTDTHKDVWFSQVSPEDIKQYNIIFSAWYDNKEELLDIVSQCDVYIAPRLYEGIGMSFLEAMAMGKCVIAPNLPTMNEYIEDKKNGLLFDVEHPVLLDLSQCTSLGLQAQRTTAKGFQQWKKMQKQIIDFIADTSSILPKTHSPSLSAMNANMVFSRNLNFLHIYFNGKSFQKSSVVLYGAGTGASLVHSIIPEAINYIVDADESKQGDFLHGVPIYAPKKLYENEEAFVIITVFGREEKIYDFLIQDLTISPERIIMIDLFN